MYLHGQVQSRVPVHVLDVGIGSVDEQCHGGLVAPPLGQDV